MKTTKLQILIVLANNWHKSVREIKKISLKDDENSLRFYLKQNAKDFGLSDDFSVEFDSLNKKIVVKQNDNELSWTNI